MSKNFKIFLGISYLIILFAFLYFIFTALEISKLNDFSYYKEIQSDVADQVSTNLIINLSFCHIKGFGIVIVHYIVKTIANDWGGKTVRLQS